MLVAPPELQPRHLQASGRERAAGHHGRKVMGVLEPARRPLSASADAPPTVAGVSDEVATILSPAGALQPRRPCW
jgi:hypothetical protein